MSNLAAAEAVLQRRAAVQRLMATGATRPEAEAAVTEELGYAITRDVRPAVEEIGRALGQVFVTAVEAATDAARQLGVVMARAHAGQVPPWQVSAGRRRRDYKLVR